MQKVDPRDGGRKYDVFIVVKCSLEVLELGPVLGNDGIFQLRDIPDIMDVMSAVDICYSGLKADSAFAVG